MKTHLRVFAIVVFILAIGCGTASAYSKTNMQSVIINVDGVPRMVSTEAETVGEMLEEFEKNLDTEYFLEDAKEEDTIASMMTISLTSVTEKIVVSTGSIPYQTIEKENPSMQAGKTKVVQSGVNGKSSIVSKEIYHGSELIETKFVEEKTITPAQDEIIEIGTAVAKAPEKTENVIQGMTYSKVIQAKATAYSPYDAGCSGITATGTKAGYGTLAVDPNVIPLGSRVYIPGYGVATAADTGGAIKGSRVDVCFNSRGEALNWGVQNVPIYILK